MKKITQIKLQNYRAFYGEDDKLQLPSGENAFIYGENGSGKSSVYKAFGDVLKAADPLFGVNSETAALSKNVYAKQIDDNAETSITWRIADQNNVHTEHIRTSTGLNPNADFIQTARQTLGLLSYVDIIRLHFESDTSENKNLFDLFMLLTEHRTNPVSGDLFGTEWKKIQRLTELRRNSVDFKTINNTVLPNFNDGLKQYFADLKAESGGSLDKFLSADNFNTNLEVTFDFEGVWFDTTTRKLEGKKIYFQITFDTFNVAEHNPSYADFLNEARLSGLSISFYLASVKNQPANSELKILFLDDVFIGLDMSNRIPLLKILKEHFANHQIFITTHDRNWYELAKRWFKNHGVDGKWKFFEMYASKELVANILIPKPHIKHGYRPLENAQNHFAEHDYPAAALYLRKYVEERLKEILPKNLQQNEPKEGKQIVKITKLHDLWKAFKKYCEDETVISFDNFKEIELYKDLLMNPLAHDNITTSYYRGELEKAFVAVKVLEQFKIKIILPAESVLIYDLSNDTATWHIEIKLLEPLRLIKDIGEDSVSVIDNPTCKIQTLIKNGVPHEDTNEKKLKELCKHLKRAFEQNRNSIAPDFFEVLKLPNGDLLSTLREF